MPIVTVEVIAGGAMAHEIAQLLADAIGHALRSPPGQTWVRVRSLARDQYAENESLLDAAELPVFVTILRRHSPQGAALEGEVTALTRAVAKVIGRPEACVHIEFAPTAVGRLSFGGILVK